jgi:hypothetical protein
MLTDNVGPHILRKPRIRARYRRRRPLRSAVRVRDAETRVRPKPVRRLADAARGAHTRQCHGDDRTGVELAHPATDAERRQRSRNVWMIPSMLSYPARVRIDDHEEDLGVLGHETDRVRSLSVTALAWDALAGAAVAAFGVFVLVATGGHSCSRRLVSNHSLWGRPVEARIRSRSRTRPRRSRLVSVPVSWSSVRWSDWSPRSSGHIADERPRTGKRGSLSRGLEYHTVLSNECELPHRSVGSGPCRSYRISTE